MPDDDAPDISTPSIRPPFDFHLTGPIFNPFDWYWVADDGRVYSSKRQVVVVDTNDPTFVAWKLAEYVPTIWPRDLAGNQTDAALQDVLTPLGKSL
ncbi:hypothetical protein G6321_00031300 [Bradyrhizobium barranii subsp. barranii]|uniref:Uncharacterized protein n=1 Tax=Bradyrhizobium barranii subsp. barranii TaxID=2823807 RepID=A0A7Z0QI00_9BRAD|nr:hypothetical protein [Bradyrhizobium barranii]UGX90323.1 hypothetical protein G6321_00031300 [Bradyrhizobium barranii subsp. barranii]